MTQEELFNERKKFEEFCRNNYLEYNSFKTLDDKDIIYYNRITALAWLAWKEATKN